MNFQKSDQKTPGPGKYRAYSDLGYDGGPLDKANR